MFTIEYEGEKFQVDEEGFLTDFKAWNENWAQNTAQNEKIELSPEHWQVINVLRDYFQEHKVPPMVRIINRLTGFDSKYIYKLFPSGPGHGACKIAGLSKPHGCF